MLRKTDIAYLLFFTTHIPIIYLIDTAPLQPSWAISPLSTTLREFYVNTYRDKFFDSPAPPWFTTFIWMEVLYHVPASLWAVWGLLKGESTYLCDTYIQLGCAALRTTACCYLIQPANQFCFDRTPPHPGAPARLRHPGLHHVADLFG